MGRARRAAGYDQAGGVPAVRPPARPENRSPDVRQHAPRREPVAHRAGDYTVVDVPLRFEAAELTGRVSYDRAGQVSGLFFLNKD